MLFDHVDLRVSDFGKTRQLYDALLPAMGYTRIAEDEESICYYRPNPDRKEPFFAINVDPGHRPNGSRIALRAGDRGEVDRLAAIARRTFASSTRPSITPRSSRTPTATNWRSATGRSRNGSDFA
jgi:hypothetical protein